MKLKNILFFVVLVTILSGCSQIKATGNPNIKENQNHMVEEKKNDSKPQVNQAKYADTISAAGDHSIVVDSKGGLWLWGETATEGESKRVLTPKQVAGVSEVAAVTGDYGYSLFLKKDGTVWGWGNNRYGVLGDGTRIDRIKPVQVTGLEKVKEISSFNDSALALKEDGTVWAWGDRLYGQLGTSREDGEYAAQVPGLAEITAIEAGSSSSIALKKDGTVWAWGYGPQVDIATKGPANTPSQVEGIDQVIDVAAKGDSLLALKKDGTVWEWGGGGPPVKIEGLPKIKRIGLGSTKGYAVDDEGRLWSWKVDETPKLEGGLSNIIQLSAGDDYIMVRDEHGDLWTWGENSHGQLGDGTVESRNTPKKISLTDKEPLEGEYTDRDVFTIKKNDTTVKFSLQFPESWKGKYVIKQYEDQIDIFHNTALENPAWIMNISGATPEEWAASPPDEYPWNKLGEINGVVIVYTQLADQAYESTYVEEEEEVTKMLMDIEDVQLIEADESED